MPNIVKAIYQDFSVFFTEDGWLNATRIAEQYGKRVDHYLANAETREYIAALNFDANENTRDSGYLKIGKSGISPHLKARETAYIKTKRGKNGGTWLHPELAVHFGRWLDVRFAIWCDRNIRALLSGTHQHYDWKRLRHEATSSYKVMNAVLQLQRQMQGKPVAPHHFSNEARLINWALTGEFKGVDREQLSAGDLDVLAKLEERNTVLMGCGLNYAERKKALERFAADWRTACADLGEQLPGNDNVRRLR